MRPRTDLDRGQHSRDKLDRHGVAVKVGVPTGKRRRGDNKICCGSGGKSECLLFWSQGDRAHTGFKPPDLVERWWFTIRSWHNKVGWASISLILVDQCAIHLSHSHKE